MENKDIHEWLLDEGIDALLQIATKDGVYSISDVLEKHLKEQLVLIMNGEPIVCGTCYNGTIRQQGRRYCVSCRKYL